MHTQMFGTILAAISGMLALKALAGLAMLVALQLVDSAVDRIIAWRAGVKPGPARPAAAGDAAAAWSVHPGLAVALRPRRRTRTG